MRQRWASLFDADRNNARFDLKCGCSSALTSAPTGPQSGRTAMSSIDDPARRLGLNGGSNTRSLLADMAHNWRQPSLSLVLLLAGLQNYVKKIWHLFQGSGVTSGLLPGLGSSSVATDPSTATGPFFAIGAYATITLLSFITAKLWSLYNYVDPLNSLTRHAYIDSRHTTQVESHKWLTCILEASHKYKKSRDLDASNFQSVRDRQNSDESMGGRYDRYDRWGERARQPTKVLEVIHDPARPPSEVPIFFQPRDTDEFWFFKFGTVFRIIKRAPRNVRRPATGFNDDYDDYGQAEPAIQVRCFSRTRKPLMLFLAYARDEYLKGFKENLYCQVFTFDDYQWNASAMRMGRGFDTIIIPEPTKQKLLDDVEEFLESQDWYSSRGIPWKRGIMFSGPPGNGKSSTIQALASTFDLPIYILPVASAGFSDSTLSRAVSRLSSKCILVLEDLDALNLKNSHRTPVTATGDMTEAEISRATSWINSKKIAMRPGRRGRFRAPGGIRGTGITDPDFSGERLSLSAILNVLDGIDSGEGRIVIASTNHLNFLQFDEALLRPGRFDLFIEFKKATKEQARDLFLQFYKDYRSKVEILEKELAPDDEFKERLALGAKEVNVLADEFKGMVEDEEFSVAALQGHLIAYKTNPYLAVREMPAWVSEKRKSPDVPKPDDIPVFKKKIVDSLDSDDDESVSSFRERRGSI